MRRSSLQPRASSFSRGSSRCSRPPLHHADEILLQARAGCRVRDDALRVAVDDALRGLADAGEAGDHHGVRGERAAGRIDAHVVVEAERLAQDHLLVRERGVQFGDIDLALADARPLVPRAASMPMPSGRACPVRAASTRWSMPVIHAGRFAHLAREIARGEDDRRRAVGDRRAVVHAERRRDVRARRASPRRRSRRVTCAAAFDFRVAAGARGDLGHLALGRLAGVEHRARLQGGDADAVRPERLRVVRIELQRQHVADVAQRRLAERVHQRGVDVAALEAHPRFVQRPRAVHLDV